MNRREFLCASSQLAVLASASAAESRPLPQQARDALAKATRFMRSISAEGGYLWRYSLDLKERAGETKATATQVWIQPPGTPSMGMTFLRAYSATRDTLFLDAARAAGDALATGQLESGGWDYLIDFDPAKASGWLRRSDIGKVADADRAKRKNVSTFDDDNSQSAVRFLLALADATKGSADPRDVRIRIALDYALKKMLEAQYPNGAWPQRADGLPRKAADYPVIKATIPTTYPREYTKENYTRHYTLNDNTQRDCILTLLDAWHRTGRRELLDAVKRGAEFLLLAQLPEPQPTWAQQYNARMEPAWARAFEPPAACSNESVGVLRLLTDLYVELGDERYLEPLPRAIAWFKRSEISPGLWARYYELGTNKPIFGDRDGKIYYRLEDISEERRKGYSWRGDYGVQGAIARYEEVKQRGREAMQARLKFKPPTAEQKASRAKSMEARVQSAIAALDAQGRWVTKGDLRRRDFDFGDRIETSTFIRNVELLADYLEAAQ
ncbi:MAG: pectate lyase [Limisphaerales bacterium]